MGERKWSERSTKRRGRSTSEAEQVSRAGGLGFITDAGGLQGRILREQWHHLIYISEGSVWCWRTAQALQVVQVKKETEACTRQINNGAQISMPDSGLRCTVRIMVDFQSIKGRESLSKSVFGCSCLCQSHHTQTGLALWCLFFFFFSSESVVERNMEVQLAWSPYLSFQELMKILFWYVGHMFRGLRRIFLLLFWGLVCFSVEKVSENLFTHKIIIIIITELFISSCGSGTVSQALQNNSLFGAHNHPRT